MGSTGHFPVMPFYDYQLLIISGQACIGLPGTYCCRPDMGLSVAAAFPDSYQAPGSISPAASAPRSSHQDLLDYLHHCILLGHRIPVAEHLYQLISFIHCIPGQNSYAVRILALSITAEAILTLPPNHC